MWLDVGTEDSHRESGHRSAGRQQFVSFQWQPKFVVEGRTQLESSVEDFQCVGLPKSRPVGCVRCR